MYKRVHCQRGAVMEMGEGTYAENGIWDETQRCELMKKLKSYEARGHKYTVMGRTRYSWRNGMAFSL